MLRRAWPSLTDEFTALFGRCLQSCTFPKTWKEAKLVVIPKAGKKDKMATGAYRPNSLLPTLGKALETLIIDRLETETKLDSIGEQHGYVRDRSTMTAIKAMYNWIDRCPNRHLYGVFLDITGAFDHARWSPLLDKAKELGASGNTLNLLKSYLSNRTATLTIDGVTMRKEMSRGCPQGSRTLPLEACHDR